MEFIELTVTTTTIAEELVADVFWEFTDYGVAISAVDEVIKLLQGDVIYDYYDESILQGAKGVSLVKGYFPKENGEKLIESVRMRLNFLRENSEINLGTLETIKRVVDGDDWLTIWKKHFKPIDMGKVTICPEWIDHHCDNILVKIDSNLAFGTGEHETTSMIINSMQSYIMHNSTVLDLGTGSGILGICSAKMGAKKVVMTDIDSVAVEVAKRNVELNSVSSVCEIYCQGDLSKIDTKFDLCLANITAEVLTSLSDSMASVMKSGGVMILSGILCDRVEKVVNCFNKLSFDEISREQKGEWCSVVLKKFA